jgi:hypothetical protein
MAARGLERKEAPDLPDRGGSPDSIGQTPQKGAGSFAKQPISLGLGGKLPEAAIPRKEPRFRCTILAQIPDHPINRIQELLPWNIVASLNSDSPKPLSHSQ